MIYKNIRHTACFILPFFFLLFLAYANVSAQGTELNQPFISEIVPQQVAPSNNQTDVPVNTSVSASFSEPMDIFSLDFTLNPEGNPSQNIEGETQWNENLYTLTFYPNDLLLYDTKYTVDLDILAYSLSTNILHSQYEWFFFTQTLPLIHYYTINGLSLNNYRIPAIAGVENGDIWVALDDDQAFNAGGLFRFDGQQWHTISESLGLINAMVKGVNGGIWFATEPSQNNVGGGVHFFDGKTWAHYTTTNSTLSSNIIKSITIDSQGKIWIGWGGLFSSGIASFNGQSWNNYNNPGNWITTILSDASDTLWVGTQFDEIFSFNPLSGVWSSHALKINQDTGIDSFIANSFASETNHIWIGTNIGLLLYNKTSKHWELFSKETGHLPDNYCSSLLWDSSRNALWIGTLEGVVLHDTQHWLNIPLVNAGPGIQAIALDSFGHTWMGTDTGLSRYNTAHPFLKDLIPQDKQENITVKSGIILNFSGPMDQESVLNALQITPPLTYTSSWDSYSTQLELTPVSQMAYSTEYTLALNNNATDIFGYTLLTGHTWSFKTEAQKTTPSTPSTPAYSFPNTNYPNTNFSFFSTGYSRNNFSSTTNFNTTGSLNLFNSASSRTFSYSPSFATTSSLNTNFLQSKNIFNTSARGLFAGTYNFSTQGFGVSNTFNFPNFQTSSFLKQPFNTSSANTYTNFQTSSFLKQNSYFNQNKGIFNTIPYLH